MRSRFGRLRQGERIFAEHLAVVGDGGGIGGAAFLGELGFEFAEFGDVGCQEGEVGGSAGVVVFGGFGAEGGAKGGEGLRGSRLPRKSAGMVTWA